MHHGVVLFSGREGSSALIAHLGRHPQVVVPLFEHLDRYLLEAAVPAADLVHLPLALRRTLRAGRFEPGWFAGEGAGLPAPDAAGRRTLFKWRGWRLDAAVAEALAAEGAGLFLLQRRDLLGLHLSLFFGRHVLGGGARLVHPQFEILHLPPAARPGYLAALQARRFHADVPALVAAMAGQVAAQRARLAALAGFAAHGVALVPIWYEAFLGAPEGVLRDMLAALGLAWDPAVAGCEYVKTMRADLRAQVENRAAVEAAAEIRALEAEWAALCDEFAALGSARGA
jgi:hypothetical protein